MSNIECMFGYHKSRFFTCSIKYHGNWQCIEKCTVCGKILSKQRSEHSKERVHERTCYLNKLYGHE